MRDTATRLSALTALSSLSASDDLSTTEPLFSAIRNTHDCIECLCQLLQEGLRRELSEGV